MTDEELKSLFETLRQENASAHTETRRDFGALREEFNALRNDNEAAHTETRRALRQENEAAHIETRRALRQENEAAHTETRRHFDIAVEAFKHEIRLVAEGVAQTREEVSRTAADHDERIDRNASETQAMIKFSHAELDRRMRTLEDGFADLQARVERLESSTH